MKLKNKFIITIIVLIICAYLSYGLAWGRYIVPLDEVFFPEINRSCSEIYSNITLKLVNSIEDIDSGILSGGNVYRKTLLFANGLILEFSRWDNVDTLILNRSYSYYECQTSGGFLNMMEGFEKELILEDKTE